MARKRKVEAFHILRPAPGSQLPSPSEPHPLSEPLQASADEDLDPEGDEDLDPEGGSPFPLPVKLLVGMLLLALATAIGVLFVQNVGLRAETRSLREDVAAFDARFGKVSKGITEVVAGFVAKAMSDASGDVRTLRSDLGTLRSCIALEAAHTHEIEIGRVPYLRDTLDATASTAGSLASCG